MRYKILRLLMISLILISGCIPRSEIGMENERCFDDRSCLNGLVCNENFICVREEKISDAVSSDIANSDTGDDNGVVFCGNQTICSVETPYCDTVNGACVQCLNNEHCFSNASCQNNVCKCNNNYGNCNSTWSDGCEIEFGSAGGCGKDCENIKDCQLEVKNVISAVCSNFTCDYSECLSQFADKDGIRSNGCEILDYFPRVYDNFLQITKVIRGFDDRYLFIGKSKNDSGVYGEMDKDGNILYAKTGNEGEYFSDIFRIDDTAYFVVGYHMASDKVFILKDTKDRQAEQDVDALEYDCAGCETLNIAQYGYYYYTTVRQSAKFIAMFDRDFAINKAIKINLPDYNTFTGEKILNIMDMPVVFGTLSNQNEKQIFMYSLSNIIDRIDKNIRISGFNNAQKLIVKDVLYVDNGYLIAAYLYDGSIQGVVLLFISQEKILWSKLLKDINAELGNISLYALNDYIYVFIYDMFSSSTIAFSFAKQNTFEISGILYAGKYDNIRTSSVVHHNEDPLFILSGSYLNKGLVMAINDNLSVYYDCPFIKTGISSLEEGYLLSLSDNVTSINMKIDYDILSNISKVTRKYTIMYPQDLVSVPVCNGK